MEEMQHSAPLGGEEAAGETPGTGGPGPSGLHVGSGTEGGSGPSEVQDGSGGSDKSDFQVGSGDSGAPGPSGVPMGGGAEGGSGPSGARVGPGRSPQALRGELAQFLQTYPGVSGEDIPKAVWKAAAGGQNLTLAYALHENEALRQRLEALERHQDNVRRSTGSQARNAPSSMGDLIAQWWAAD